MKLTPEQKTQAVTHLVTNCDCWKGKEAALNALDDEVLVDIYNDKVILADAHAAAVELTGNADLTVNAMAGAMKGMKKKAKAGCDDEETVENGAPMAGRLTPEEQEAVTNALAITAQEKAGLVAQLVANVADADLKARLTVIHGKKPLAQLRDEAAALPKSVTANKADDRFADLRPRPIFIGAAGNTSKTTTTTPAKPKPIPTVNIDWSKPVEKTPNTPTGTRTA